MSDTSDRVTISLGGIEALVREVFELNGCDAANAEALTRTIVAAERDDCPTHGLFRVPGYVASLRSGKVKGNAAPSMISRDAGTLKLDGDGGFAPLALERGIPVLATAAKDQGIAALAISDTFHFAALWHETEALAKREIAAIACVNYAAVVAPAGGHEAIFGTNPISFAWPRPGKAPVVFDMATSAMAQGDIQIAAQENRTLPEGVGLDANGQPSTIPSEVLRGVQLPFGGYKGSAIALMVEMLAAGLTGGPFSTEAAEDVADGGPPRGAELLIAIDPERFAGSDWSDHAEGFLKRFEGIRGARLPGLRRHRARSTSGSRPVARVLLEELEALCRRT